MSREELETAISDLSRNSYSDGIRLSARMARDLREQMLAGKIPAVNGADALQLLAEMCDRLVAQSGSKPLAHGRDRMRPL